MFKLLHIEQERAHLINKWFRFFQKDVFNVTQILYIHFSVQLSYFL